MQQAVVSVMGSQIFKEATALKLLSSRRNCSVHNEQIRRPINIGSHSVASYSQLRNLISTRNIREHQKYPTGKVNQQGRC